MIRGRCGGAAWERSQRPHEECEALREAPLRLRMPNLGNKYGVSVFTEDFVEQLKRSGQW